jgi:hypothetical protein
MRETALIAKVHISKGRFRFEGLRLKHALGEHFEVLGSGRPKN